MNLLAFLLVGAAVSLSSQAGPAQKPTPAAPAAAQPAKAGPGLESVYWRLTHLGDTEANFAKNLREPHLSFFPGGTVTGADGCNTLRGSYTTKDDALTFGPLMGTLMACPQLPDKLDNRFREALGNTKKWKASATELTLLDEKDTVLARFEAVPR